jgi:hypothetical protein
VSVIVREPSGCYAFTANLNLLGRPGNALLGRMQSVLDLAFPGMKVYAQVFIVEMRKYGCIRFRAV